MNRVEQWIVMLKVCKIGPGTLLPCIHLKKVKVSLDLINLSVCNYVHALRSKILHLPDLPNRGVSPHIIVDEDEA